MKKILFKIIVFITMVYVFLVFSFAFAQSDPDSTKAPFGKAYQLNRTTKYHIYSDCFVLKGKQYQLVDIDSSYMCKHCVNKLYLIEAKYVRSN